MTAAERLSVLGGGPAGLAAAYYARRTGLELTVYEAGAEAGGNCRTLRHGDFLFDTGAHRLHDRDPQVTAEIRRLMGDDLLEVHAPSQISWGGEWIDFPLSPYDLASKLPARTLLRIAGEIVRQRLSPASPALSFRDHAVSSYGETLAEMFLLGYSRKLWGEDTARLSPAVAGSRLRHLDLKTFLIEAVRGKREKTEHLDGSFYYPRHGIGSIFDRVQKEIGPSRIRLGARVTGLAHARGGITALEVNGRETVSPGTVVSSLPLPLMLRLLRPAPPAELLEIAGSMRFRHLVLGVFLLDRDRLTPNASLYFPDPAVPFTRIYESKNRSAEMAPAGRTSIVLEIPCQREDAWWAMSEEEMRLALQRELRRLGLVDGGEVLGFRSYRVPFAYPILETGFEARSERLLAYLERFENLHMVGRSARFRYTHIHDMFRMGREVVEEIERRGGAGRARSGGRLALAG